MGKSSSGESLFKKLSSEIHCQYNSRYTAVHKKAWLYLVTEGSWPFSPYNIRAIIQKLTSLPEYQPRGRQLLCLKLRNKFTLLPSGKPGRPEEALERLIVHSNINMYGQMPVGGRKESVDIVKVDHSNCTLIESKPWRSNNSPLYALLESLKKLLIYRVLKSQNHPNCKTFNNVHLAILAPLTYYKSHCLIDENLQICNRLILQEFFNEISMAFNTNIQIIAIDWSEEVLLKVCSDLSPKRPLEAKVVSVFGYPAIEFFNEKNWVTLLSAGS